MGFWFSNSVTCLEKFHPGACPKHFLFPVTKQMLWRDWRSIDILTVLLGKKKSPVDVEFESINKMKNSRRYVCKTAGLPMNDDKRLHFSCFFWRTAQGGAKCCWYVTANTWNYLLQTVLFCSFCFFLLLIISEIFFKKEDLRFQNQMTNISWSSHVVFQHCLLLLIFPKCA